MPRVYWEQEARFWANSFAFWRKMHTCDKAYHLAHADTWYRRAYSHVLEAL